MVRASSRADFEQLRANCQYQEMDRVSLLEQRDGLEATVKWVERTIEVYQAAIADPDKYGMYKEKMAREVEILRGYLARVKKLSLRE